MQSKTHSLIEVLANISTGFVISAFVQACIVPRIWPEVHTSFSQNMWITVLFTVVSIVRSYIFRRVFNKIGAKP